MGSYCSSNFTALQSLNDGPFCGRSEFECLEGGGYRAVCGRDAVGAGGGCRAVWGRGAVGGRSCCELFGIGARFAGLFFRASDLRDTIERVFFFERDFRGGEFSSGP